MQFKNLQWEVNNQVGVLTLHRPSALNALNSELINELDIFLKTTVEETPIHALIMTGARKSFCVGADIKEMSGFDSVSAEAFSEKGQRVLWNLECLDVPTISAVNGFALGGGLELALACDALLLSAEAKVGLPETKLGLFPAFGGLYRLPSVVGMPQAKEMVFSAQVYSAQEALSMGLGNKIFSGVQLIKEAFTFAQTFKTGEGLQKAKSFLRLSEGRMDKLMEENIQKTAKSFGELFASAEMGEKLKKWVKKS